MDRRNFTLQILIGSLISSPEFLVRREENYLYVEDILQPHIEYQMWKVRHWKQYGEITNDAMWDAGIIAFVIPEAVAEFIDCERISTGQTGHLLSLLNDLGLAVWFMETSSWQDDQLELPLPIDWFQFAQSAERLFNPFDVVLPSKPEIYVTFDDDSAMKLKEAIFPFVVPSKRTKFGKYLLELHDISKSVSKTQMQIQKVGIRQVPIPLTIHLRSEPFQTIATASVYTNLQPEVMGSHLSRLVEVLNSVSSQPLATDLQTMQSLLSVLQERLKATNAYLKLRFPILIAQEAPVSKIKGMVHYDCTLSGEIVDGDLKVLKTIRVPYVSSCICSKTISLFNAHNQRSFADVTLMLRECDYAFEDIIEIVEGCCSAPIRALLKREDEKFITEACFDYAGFVESICRQIADNVAALDVRGWLVVCEHLESIHQHNAVALIRGGEYIP